ncbi:hypothetical protein BDF19DRAFT_420570 [Syncephalis fuscata]|nr:hypothetical protein BDF19DRAFT_420570 [Syncephalis fuscata]
MDELLRQFDALPSVDRVNCICRMVDRMTYSQVRRLQEALDGHWTNAHVINKQLDALGLLPNELAIQVLTYLDWREIIQCRKISKRWYALATANSLWKQQCQRYLTLDSMTTAYYWLFRQQQYHNEFIDSYLEKVRSMSIPCHYPRQRVSSAATPPVALESTIDWLALFTWTANRECNWHQGQPALHQVILSGHMGRLQQILLLPNNLMLTGSFDRSMVIWQLKNDASAIEWLRWECDSIVSLDALLLYEPQASQMDSPYPIMMVIIASHFDRLCTLWHIAIDKEHQTLYVHKNFTLRGHMAPIKQVYILQACAVSYGDAAELLVWNWINGEQLFRFNIAQWMVSDLLINAHKDNSILLASQTGAIIGFTVPDSRSSSSPPLLTTQTPDIETLRLSTQAINRPAILRWISSGEIRSTDTSSIFARIDDIEVELFLFKPGDSMAAITMELTLLATIKNGPSLHFPLAINERRMIASMPLDIMTQPLPALTPMFANNTIATNHSLDRLFSNKQLKTISHDHNGKKLLLDHEDSNNLWQCLLNARLNLENKRTTSLVVDACRLVVGCIDGTIFIWQFAPQRPIPQLKKQLILNSSNNYTNKLSSLHIYNQLNKT